MLLIVKKTALLSSRARFVWHINAFEKFKNNASVQKWFFLVKNPAMKYFNEFSAFKSF
jgi:hypothetical protein